MKYIYTFNVHPNIDNFSLIKLFEDIPEYIEIIFTEKEFNEFRSELLKFNLVLSDITRIPYPAPEEIK